MAGKDSGTMRVLVVEDFEILARTIGTGLRREGMAVDVALDGDDALEHLAVTRYDVVVLDRDLPGVHGDEVCRQIVAGRSQSRVLMLTAASTVKERVDGLGLGADDYLPKPFDFAELGPQPANGGLDRGSERVGRFVPDSFEQILGGDDAAGRGQQALQYGEFLGAEV